MKQLIRKILKEERDLKQTLKKQIEDDGWENTSKLVGGLENLIKIIYDGNLKEYCKDRIKETILYQTEIQDPNNFEDAEEYADFCISTSFDMYYNEDYDYEDNDDDYDDYSESEKNLINDLYDELHYELYEELIGIYNDFKEDETDINESKKDINKHSDAIRSVIENEEKDQLTLVKNLIYQLFDDVKSIEVIDANKNVHNNYKKPLIKVYFENDSEAKNEESNFDMKIYRTIYDYTGLAVFPYWKTDWADVADFYLASIKIKNDENNNVVNEGFVYSENDYEKYKNVISNLIYEYFDKNEICGIELESFRFEEDDTDSIRIKIIFKEQKDFRDFFKIKEQLKDTIQKYIPLFYKVFVTRQIGFCPDTI